MCNINIMYPNVQNMIVVPATKGMEIIMSIHVCLISRMNFDYKENGEKKGFLVNPKYQHHASQCGEHDCSDNKKRNRDYYEYRSLSYFKKEQ